MNRTDKINSSIHTAARFPGRLRAAFILVIYLAFFAAMDMGARTLEVYPGVVAWYPPDGLSFAMLLTFGWAFVPAFVIASLISSVLIFQIALSFISLLGWAIFLALTYAAAVWFLRRITMDIQLRNMRDLLWLIVAASVASTILASSAVSASVAGGTVPPSVIFWATFQWWTGEMIGILVLTPALLIHIMPQVKQFIATGMIPTISVKRPSSRVLLQALSIIVAIYLAVAVSWPNNFHPYFLIGFPLVWIALEHGLAGASLGNVVANFGITWAVQQQQHFELGELGQLQSMMLVITMTSLVIGMIVTDHRDSGQSPIPEIEQRRKKIAYELVIVSALAMTAWILEYTYNFFKIITNWELSHQIEGIDETLATILVLGLASAVFSLRRWREYEVELRKREKAQAELHTLYSILEVKVEERTADLSKANRLLKTESLERGQAEIALRESEKRFRALFTTSPDAMLLIDPYNTETSWPIVDCNEIACQMNGYTREELIGQSINILNLKDGTKEEQDRYLEHLRNEGVAHLEAIHRHKDGHVFSVETSTSLFTFEGRQLVLGIDRDITERRQAALALEQSERRFRALVEHSMEEVSLVNPQGTLIFESPSTRRPLGYTADFFLGHNLFDLFHPDDRAAAAGLLARVSEKANNYGEAVFRLKHHDGSWRWMEGALTNLLQEPAVGAIVINYRDVTERKLAEQEIQTRTNELLTLYELSRALANANDLETILELVNRRTVESVHATFACIAILEDGELIIRSAYPARILERDLLINQRVSIASLPSCKRILEQDEPQLLRAGDAEISSAERALLLLDFTQTISLIPLRVHEFATNSTRILGMLMIGETRSEAREPFTQGKMHLARSIGNQAAIAIDKARLFNDLQRSNIDLSLAYEATIEGWSAALDLRDKETEGHTLRVTQMTLRLAQEMGLREQDLVHVRRGALLHDIGKMGVPDRILLKPDKLTEEEWEIMRLHPAYAYHLLQPISYLSGSLDIPYCHHEKWDGTGYPRGLSGEKIPFTARIFAVVDVYDALTSDRPYRLGWSRQKTVDYIREQTGTHFDPHVVDAFLKMLNEEFGELSS